MTKFLLGLLFCPALVIAQSAETSGGKKEEGAASWEGFREKFVCPEWFADAKFGIWAHWGAQSVPDWGGGWYARHMYMPDPGRETFGKRAYPWHLKTYGHPSEVGFKDVIHQWKAERFEPEKLLSYFKGLGARYFVAMANHHDHFDNFDSSHHEWNSVRVGPKRDIIGEWGEATRKVGLPFGVSSHDDRFLDWWLAAFSADQEGPLRGVPYDGRMTMEDGKGKWWEGLDPVKLYGLPPEKRSAEWVESVGRNFADRHLELVTKYQPDFLWFDGYGFPYGKYGREVCTELYRQSLAQHGVIKAVVCGKFTDEPSTIRDIERGVAEGILKQPWQGTTTFTSWFLKKDKEMKHDARSLAEVLMDIVSKNGNFLLSVEMRPDGTIPEEHRRELDAFGAWLSANAEAVYGTRPWKVHGDNLHSIQRRLAAELIGEADLQAAAKNTSGHFNERTKLSEPYGADEVRFTTHGERFFVTVLNPRKGALRLSTLGVNGAGVVKKAWQLVGGKVVPFEQTEKELILHVPGVSGEMPLILELEKSGE